MQSSASDAAVWLLQFMIWLGSTDTTAAHLDGVCFSSAGLAA